MKNLLEIVQILTKKKIAKIEILDEQTLKNKDSKFGIFYEALMTGKIASDQEAAKILYGKPEAGNARYRQLKSRFKRRLYNTLFFLDVNAPLTSNRAQAQFNCNKEWALVEIMLAYDARTPAISLARQILTIALKFHFTHLVVKSAQLLREQAVLDENEKLFEEYNAYVKQFTPVLEIEIRAEELSQKAELAYQTRFFEEKGLDHLEQIGNELISLTEKTDSPQVHYHMYAVWVLYYELLQAYEEILEVIQKAKDYLRSNPDYFDEHRKSYFLIKKFAVYLHLQQYREGKAQAEELLSELQPDSMEWFDFMEYYLLLSLHTENMINALAVFNKVADSPGFKKLDEARREKWELFEAFFHYFIEVEDMNPNLLLRQRRKAFKFSDFINQPVNYPAKYVTLTIHHTVLKILFLLFRRNYSAIPKLLEQLRKLSRYELTKDGYERATAMVKLLYQLEKADFQMDKLKSVDRYLQKLEDNRFFYRGKISELEVIPYHKLWQMLCRHLE